MDKIMMHENTDLRCRVTNPSDLKTCKSECSYHYKPQPCATATTMSSAAGELRNMCKFKTLKTYSKVLILLRAKLHRWATRGGSMPAPAPGPVQGGFLPSWEVRFSPSLQSIPEPLLGPEGPGAWATAYEMLKTADTPLHGVDLNM